MDRTISSEILVSYSQCPRKAYLLLCTSQRGVPHEYVRILQQQKEALQREYIKELKQKNADVQSYSTDNLRNGSSFLINAELKTDGFEAECGILTKIVGSSAFGRYSYEPTLFIGTHKTDKYQKLALFFVGYVLGQIQSKQPAFGRIVGMDGGSHRVKLENSSKALIPFLEPLQEWSEASSSDPPALILSKHCVSCQFESVCKDQAEHEDSLSLLSTISTSKAIKKYEKKGIFTVKQLSYLFKPRKRKKGGKKPPAIHKPELQALAIRTGKIYLQELPELSREPVELFLDIEGVPDQQFYYLIGLLICKSDTSVKHSFWADTHKDEATIWQRFVEKANQYPNAPIYHYGSFELKVISKLAGRYETDNESLKNRLVNVNKYIYGRIYFPIRSNRLKDIGNFIGASWTSAQASGLQSLVWRQYWEESQDTEFKDLLVRYNEEDCQALKLLTDELSRIKHSADILSEVDFANQPKRHATESGEVVHSQFKAILKFAHADYQGKKITLWQNEKGGNGDKRKRGAPKGHQGYSRTISKPHKVVHVPRRRKCPEHKGQFLQSLEEMAERTIIDLVFTRNGVRKTITRYVGKKGYCTECRRYYSPHAIDRLGSKMFGHGFQAWVIYQRLFLRLPYRIITQVLNDQFNEKICESTIVNFLRYFADYYSDTAKILTQRIQESSFVHVDETRISIQGVEQCVWVFTDGSHVALRLTETREATIVHEILSSYDGILISDFYAGYDSVKCEQQKCWVHLIRDLNNDLWKTPFDTEFEMFVSEVRDLILPILEAVGKYGLKKRNLNKFRKNVDRFYERVIIDRTYKSELIIKYQKRFMRYRASLFTFLKHDGIPWNNNMAERAIRHLAIQRKISGFFFESVTHQYLLLLGIMQTCRFQDKPFLKFLLSGEKDIDKFKGPRRNKNRH